MRNFKKQILKYLVVFASGMMMYGIVQCALLTIRGRVNAVGGELFLIPLMAFLLWSGWKLGKQYWRIIERRKAVKYGFTHGYRLGTQDAIIHLEEEGK